ncbi:MAG: DUF4032 domain-containing protein [Acidimicrobiia bacterium]
MTTPHLIIRSGHPDFLDLPWQESLVGWEHPRLTDLPKGISRHEVRFVIYDQGIYVIKELPLRAARNEYEMLRKLEDLEGPAVRPVGLVQRRWVDPHAEAAAAVITRYLDYSFSYRELISGGGFGPRRHQMLDAFAGLLAELHLLGCFWGDCSLSNVLYRFDAEAIEVTMVDAETTEIHDELTQGQRLSDIDIMIANLAGGMADIAASQDVELDAADLALGEDIAGRYDTLWKEVTGDAVLGPDERYLITERINRLNELGFEVENLELIPQQDGERLRLSLRVVGRNFHAHRLHELTGVDASEHQARQILSDLMYYVALQGADSRTGKSVAAIQWRVAVFEPLLSRISALPLRTADPLQAYCDFLHHRYVLSAAAGHDVGNEAAFEDWLAAGLPGYPLEG